MDTQPAIPSTAEEMPPEWWDSMIVQYNVARARGLTQLCERLRAEWAQHFGEDCLHATATGEIDF